MRSFRHRRGRIIFEIFAALLLGSLAAARWAGSGSIFALVAATGLTGYALYRLVMLFARNPALAYGDRGIQLGGLFKVSDFSWSQVRDIRERVWTRPYIPFMHWLPKERHYLEVQVQSQVIKVRPDMMELPPGGAKEVIDGLRAAQVASLGQRGAAMARLGARPDEQRGPATGVQAERLQRLGLGTDESDHSPIEASPIMPARPTGLPPRPAFGRKAS